MADSYYLLFISCPEISVIDQTGPLIIDDSFPYWRKAENLYANLNASLFCCEYRLDAMTSLPVLPTGIIWEEPIPPYDDSSNVLEETQSHGVHLEEALHCSTDGLVSDATRRPSGETEKNDTSSIVDLCTLPAAALDKTISRSHSSPLRSQEPSWIEDKRTRSAVKMKQATLFQFLQHK